MRNVLVFCLLMAACGANNTRGHGDLGGGGGGDLSTIFGDTCSAQAKLVYVVDQNYTLSSFDPSTLTFNDVGTLQCLSIGGNPFSMAVDRTATAWVLYSDGELFQVDTSNTHCTKTGFMQSNGFSNFGMGFASNTAGSNDETLFIAGGGILTSQMPTTSTLATLDLSTFTATTLGTIQLWPELTGTGDANLWGFFPSAATPRVSQLDKTDGHDLKTFMAPSLAGQPSAWAFAFWGGDFWIFLQKTGDASTRVYHMKSSDGSVTVAVPNTGRTIVGAGVSTCAPIAIM